MGMPPAPRSSAFPTRTSPSTGAGRAVVDKPHDDWPALLAWPAVFTDGDRQQASAHLTGLSPLQQQAVLDEIAWYRERQIAVHSPVALTRTLAAKARDGSFVADGAHRIAAQRAAQARAGELALVSVTNRGSTGLHPTAGSASAPGRGAADESVRQGHVLSPAAQQAIAQLRAWRATVGAHRSPAVRSRPDRFATAASATECSAEAPPLLDCPTRPLGPERSARAGH